jgi:hypothetical protein
VAFQSLGVVTSRRRWPPGGLGNDADNFVIADAARAWPPSAGGVDDGQPGYSQVGAWVTAATTRQLRPDLPLRRRRRRRGVATWQLDARRRAATTCR